MGEFAELRICLEELLEKIHELEIAFNNMNKAQHSETNTVAKRVSRHDKETNDYVKILSLDESGLQESKRGFSTGETNESRFCNEFTLSITERTARSLKIYAYLLTVLALVFVVSKIYVC
jgi:hypothetical protein